MPSVLLPPLSPPLVGDRLPFADRGLALLPSVIGDNCKKPFDEAGSVGNGVKLSISSEPDDDVGRDEDKDDEGLDVKLKSVDASEFDTTLPLPELARLSPGFLLGSKLPEDVLENTCSVSEDNDDDDLLLLLLPPEATTTSLELELDLVDVDPSSDPLALAEDPADRLADESVSSE